jgi:hypothetical protein
MEQKLEPGERVCERIENILPSHIEWYVRSYNEKRVKKNELENWSLQISKVQWTAVRNWVLAFLKDHESTHYGWKSLFA